MPVLTMRTGIRSLPLHLSRRVRSPGRRATTAGVVAALLLAGGAAPAQDARRTEYVVLVTLDGLRWQNVFSGAEAALVDDPKVVAEPEQLRQRFWDDDKARRRQRLMPFLWSVIATEGRIYGNRELGNRVNVKNRYGFSYPGYNEILTGFPDERIDSNDKFDNPNVTVLEFLNRLPAFAGRIAVFASWDVFPYIVNEARSGVPVNAGLEPAAGDDLTARERFLNELMPEVAPHWPTIRPDALTHHYALEYLDRRSPKVLYVAFDETDDFAHDGEYDRYLDAIRRGDDFIADIWRRLQANDIYRDRTTLFVTTDHGRGTSGPDAWKDHDVDIVGSDEIWFAVIGPDTPAAGEVSGPGQWYQDQFAATLAGFLGVDYDAGGKAGEPIAELFAPDSE